MRLRNRQVKATWWTDPDILRWSRDKRMFYQSLWALAEDSCCIEDDMFGVKIGAWASPLDIDMSLDRFETWRRELLEEGKLVAYESEGKRYLYIPTMSEHEKPRNPQAPDHPLPPWIRWHGNLTDPRKGSYSHNLFDLRESVRTLNNNATTLPVLPCPALSCPELPCVEDVESSPVDNVRREIRESLQGRKEE